MDGWMDVHPRMLGKGEIKKRVEELKFCPD
jgi:hypothetical protein